jgi:uncharacterized membrane protein YoaK (UPF0700 family)
MELIKDLFSSKKFVAAIVFIVGLIASNLLGADLGTEELLAISAVAAAYITGQGLADLGKEREITRSAVEKIAERNVEKGEP